MKYIICVLAGWIVGGLIFFYCFRQPLEYLAPVLGFSTTIFLLGVFK